MDERKSIAPGIASLVLIFSVICMTIFSVLTLLSAREQVGLTDKLASSVQQYYQAEGQAVLLIEKVMQAIENGEKPEEIDGIAVYIESHSQGEDISFSYPIQGQNTALDVSLRYSQGTLSIIQWAKVPVLQWQGEEELELWLGT